MDVDHAVAIAMDQRRQFVHPAAIIGVVIGIFLDRLPPRRAQRALRRVDRVARHEDVEIADRSPLPRGQPRRRERRALEQDHRDAERGQRTPRHLRLPQGGAPFFDSAFTGIGEDARYLCRHGPVIEPMGERAQQSLGTRGGQHRGPVVRTERGHAGRIAQRGDEEARRLHSALHSVSTSASPASPSG